MPNVWGPPLVKALGDLNDFVRLIPRVGSKFLNRIERDGLEITLNHKELDQAVQRLDNSANRLSLSMLIAALIVGLALLVPAFNLGEQLSLATIVIIIGFVGVSLLGLWLAISIWRARK